MGAKLIMTTINDPWWERMVNPIILYPRLNDEKNMNKFLDYFCVEDNNNLFEKLKIIKKINIDYIQMINILEKSETNCHQISRGVDRLNSLCNKTWTNFINEISKNEYVHSEHFLQGLKTLLIEIGFSIDKLEWRVTIW